MKRQIAALFVATLAGPAVGFPTLSDCAWQASAQYLAEPWGVNTATFGNGATRIAVIDTTEPTAGSYGLVILSPPYNDFGERQCMQLFGFSALSLDGMTSAYDPSIGIQMSLTGQVYLEEEAEFASAQVDIIIDQATGAIDHFITPYFN